MRASMRTLSIVCFSLALLTSFLFAASASKKGGLNKFLDSDSEREWEKEDTQVTRGDDGVIRRVFNNGRSFATRSVSDRTAEQRKIDVQIFRKAVVTNADFKATTTVLTVFDADERADVFFDGNVAKESVAGQQNVGGNIYLEKGTPMMEKYTLKHSNDYDVSAKTVIDESKIYYYDVESSSVESSAIDSDALTNVKSDNHFHNFMLTQAGGYLMVAVVVIVLFVILITPIVKAVRHQSANIDGPESDPFFKA